ncbi:MAG: NUDIX hydrolase [bacterium]|nr:NUDIX hydrolase [Gammaproteobacteria bacterium]HIL98780.1 NUDIX hydrolase [Pseudomonadales bacterium]
MSVIKRWERKETRLLADCRIFNLQESLTVSPFTGKEHSFYFIETADWVNIVPITSNNELVCIRQFRHGSEEITLEIPGGMVDVGEPAEIAAARECLEETGFEATNLQSLGVLNANPAIFGNRLHTYLATDVQLVSEINNTSTEQTELLLVPMDEVPELLVSGEIDHALVAATLWRALFFMNR